MTITVSGKRHPFPRPDLAGIQRHREVITQCAGGQGVGLLRTQLLTVLDRVHRVEAAVIRMLDGVRVNLEDVDIEAYQVVVQALGREGRTLTENLALVSYQEQTVNDFLGRMQSAQGYLDALNDCIESLATAEIADTQEAIGHAEALLAGAGLLGNESHRRSLEYLLEDLKGAARASDALRGYVDAVKALKSPVEFFCQNVQASGQTGLQPAEEFQRHAMDLVEYLRAVRREWRS
jgi:hypothetical protein